MPYRKSRRRARLSFGSTPSSQCPSRGFCNSHDSLESPYDLVQRQMPSGTQNCTYNACHVGSHRLKSCDPRLHQSFQHVDQSDIKNRRSNVREREKQLAAVKAKEFRNKQQEQRAKRTKQRETLEQIERETESAKLEAAQRECLQRSGEAVRAAAVFRQNLAKLKREQNTADAAFLQEQANRHRDAIQKQRLRVREMLAPHEERRQRILVVRKLENERAKVRTQCNSRIYSARPPDPLKNKVESVIQTSENTRFRNKTIRDYSKTTFHLSTWCSPLCNKANNDYLVEPESNLRSKDAACGIELASEADGHKSLQARSVATPSFGASSCSSFTSNNIPHQMDAEEFENHDKRQTVISSDDELCQAFNSKPRLTNIDAEGVVPVSCFAVHSQVGAPNELFSCPPCRGPPALSEKQIMQIKERGQKAAREEIAEKQAQELESEFRNLYFNDRNAIMEQTNLRFDACWQRQQCQLADNILCGSDSDNEMEVLSSGYEGFLQQTEVSGHPNEDDSARIG